MQKRTIQSLERAFDLLEKMAGKQEASLSHLAEATGINANTARGLLNTMMTRGYVKQDDRKGYYSLGPAVLELIQDMGSQQDLPTRVSPYMHDLQDRSGGEAVYFSCVIGTRLVPIAHIDGTHLLTIANKPDFRSHRLHLHAQGKILMATWPLTSIQEYMQTVVDSPPESCGPRAIQDTDRLLQELADVRQSGVASSYDEVGPGLGAVAVGLYNRQHKLAATIAFAVPTVRLADAARTSLAALLLEEAKLMQSDRTIRDLGVVETS